MLKARKNCDRSGSRSRPNQSLQFPIFGPPLVVIDGLVERAGEGALATVRSQARIDSVGCTFARRRPHQSQQTLTELDEIFPVADLAARPAHCRRALFRKQKDEVDVRSVVQL